MAETLTGITKVRETNLTQSGQPAGQIIVGLTENSEGQWVCLYQYTGGDRLRVFNKNDSTQIREVTITQVRVPNGITAVGDRIYVTDDYNSRNLEVYDNDLNHIEQITYSTSAPTRILGMAWPYVTTSSDRIVKFAENSDGTPDWSTVEASYNVPATYATGLNQFAAIGVTTLGGTEYIVAHHNSLEKLVFMHVVNNSLVVKWTFDLPVDGDNYQGLYLDGTTMYISNKNSSDLTALNSVFEYSINYIPDITITTDDYTFNYNIDTHDQKIPNSNPIDSTSEKVVVV